MKNKTIGHIMGTVFTCGSIALITTILKLDFFSKEWWFGVLCVSVAYILGGIRALWQVTMEEDS